MLKKKYAQCQAELMFQFVLVMNCMAECNDCEANCALICKEDH